MNTESPRLRALLAAGAALVVFGITIPATASTDEPNPNRPTPGSLDVPADSKTPPGQELDGRTDHDNGYKCDGNNGAGAGNPALTRDCDDAPGGYAPAPGEGDSSGDWVIVS